MNSRLWIPMQLFAISISHGGNGIYHGEIAEDGQFKYMALIYQSRGETYGICGGAIIDELHILMAAHCVSDSKEKDLLVFAGATTLEDLSCRRWEVEKIHVHGNFQPIRTINDTNIYIRRLFPCILDKPEMTMLPKNDVAVLRLAEALPLGENLTRVRLPESRSLPYCQELEYAGWGHVEYLTAPTRLQYTRLIIFDQEECHQRAVVHRKEQFCGIALDRMSSVAPGDSGSPLVDGDTVYGITIFIDPEDPDAPAGFTRVFTHRRFIKWAMNNRGLRFF